MRSTEVARQPTDAVRRELIRLLSRLEKLEENGYFGDCSWEAFLAAPPTSGCKPTAETLAATYYDGPEELKARIAYHRDLYYNGQPEISDEEYDKLVARLANLKAKKKRPNKGRTNKKKKA